MTGNLTDNSSFYAVGCDIAFRLKQLLTTMSFSRLSLRACNQTVALHLAKTAYCGFYRGT
ncbi:MAG: hypothetical protein CBE00_12215 [Planctomycetaceae bacterium TMED240]|nr:hypothetical protein [Rhodopirellula sp.]OUX04601.1 MAG: hypothetical protein CBE00_12215 [Planctomycetaceae bacterium TMED240]